MRPAPPLSLQLLLTFVGLLVGTTVALTRVADSSLTTNLEAEADRTVRFATRTHTDALTKLFQSRQQRADVFVAGIQSWCTESVDSGRVAWSADCVRPMVNEFRKREAALGAVLQYRDRRIARSGHALTGPVPTFGALAAVIRAPDGAARYVMRAALRDTTLTLEFDQQAVVELFADQSGLGRTGQVFLVHHDGSFLTPARHSPTLARVSQASPFLQQCRSGIESTIGLDYQGVKSFQSFRPVSAFAEACVAARLAYDEALAPAQQLRSDLVVRSAWFVLAGALLSLIAAQWIAAPVRRLAQSARQLQRGVFDRPIPLAGPSEVRALGRAFNAMGNDLAELVTQQETARRQAEEANRLKDEFLATVSHELRTPLTAMLGWAQMLQSERLSPDRVRHGIAVIERSARTQRHLIEDLLDVSRITAGRLRITREPVRFDEVVDVALDAIRPQAATNHVDIETELSERAIVLGDARRLEQVVWNLLWNAVKFTEPSGRITVQLMRVDRHVVLSVADTGIGISSAFLPHVFEWFRQADTKSRSQSGLGLGLGLVRHIVQLHGGSVRAESRGVGMGATFTVTLPVHETATPLPPRPHDEPFLAAARRRLDATRVLVVEDDEDTRELVRAALESAGAEVDAVETAEEARRQAFADPPDILISDIRMPEEDGYTLLRSLRVAGMTTPAIALTAYARREDADHARAAGFQTHVAKPVETERLLDAVAALLDKPAIQ